MQRILIVEDDITIAGIVGKELDKWGYQVHIVEDFSAVMEDFDRFDPHLVLLDLSLPHRNGFHWCGQIRKKATTPIVFLSSSADNMNMVTALHQGADDFIPKPFDLNVLIAKVQAILRRSFAFADTGDTLAYQGIVLHLGNMTLAFGGQSMELTRNEFRILHTLFAQPEKVVSRESIMRRLWEDESFIDENTLTVNVNRLRKKLEAIGLRDLIATKKGEGYQLKGEAL